MYFQKPHSYIRRILNFTRQRKELYLWIVTIQNKKVICAAVMLATCSCCYWCLSALGVFILLNLPSKQKKFVWVSETQLRWQTVRPAKWLHDAVRGRSLGNIRPIFDGGYDIRQLHCALYWSDVFGVIACVSYTFAGTIHLILTIGVSQSCSQCSQLLMLKEKPDLVLSHWKKSLKDRHYSVSLEAAELH